VKNRGQLPAGKLHQKSRHSIDGRGFPQAAEPFLSKMSGFRSGAGLPSQAVRAGTFRFHCPVSLKWDWRTQKMIKWQGIDISKADLIKTVCLKEMDLRGIHVGYGRGPFSWRGHQWSALYHPVSPSLSGGPPGHPYFQGFAEI